MAKCKSCGAEIVFVQIKKGKIMPLNAEYKTIICEDEDEFGNGLGTYEVIRGRESHFATCPDAVKFRKGGNKNG